MSALERFLATRKEGIRNLYAYGLAEFARFYQPEGTIEQFIDRVQTDLKQTDWKERKFVAQEVLKNFSNTLQAKGLAPKTVRTYISSVQSMLKRYLGVKVALDPDTLPASITLSRPYPWTIETVSQFVNSITSPMYQSLASLMFQSSLRILEARTLEYQDIQEEYEKNITPLCLDFEEKPAIKPSTPS